MGIGAPITIPVPLSSFPGANPQESAGRLINCYSEPLGDPSQQGYGAPRDATVWRRSPGLSQLAMTAQAGYRGGLLVNNLSINVFAGQVVTVDVNGVVTVLGALAGSKRVSIARNQNTNLAYPDVIIVDPDNGAFSVVLPVGAPAPLNTSGAVPAANSVAFQDSYFFLTIADGRIFASPINSIVPGSWNSLTFATAQAKSDVVLLRGIAYQGYMFFFTTASCEVWSDQAFPAPAFPYSRSSVIPTGLLQAGAIAGWENGFDNLFWVANDFGVWNMPPNTLQPTKISPPDLDRLIENASQLGATITAHVYIFAGKKFFVVTSPVFTTAWEFNVGTGKWNERSSLQLVTGSQSVWRSIGSHPAFGSWLTGDTQSGAILAVDDTNYNDVTTQDTTLFVTTAAPMMMRIETGVVDKFPMRTRVARSDFHFTRGTGQSARQSPVAAVLNTSSGTGGAVRLLLGKTLSFNEGDTTVVSAVGGTVEANGTWTVHIVDATHLELNGSVFANGYTSGGTIANVTAPPNNVTNPTAAISWSNDGGSSWSAPALRNIGPAALIKTGRVSVKNTGLTGVMGRRWRMDMSDPVYTAFLKATQSDNPTEPS
jgi:hypothetical protein